MPVYVDPLFQCRRSAKWPYTQACHMTADTEAELHGMAKKLGLQRNWFQNHDARAVMHHYDLTTNKRKQAIAEGAREITWEEWVEKVQQATFHE